MAGKSTSRRSRQSASRSRAGSRSKGGSRSRAASRSNSRDALNLLRQDHARVKELFGRFEKARSEEQKAKLAETICNELKVHAQIEEDVFYPAVREALEDEELIDEAQVEHESAKQLIAQIEGGSAGDPLFDARVKVLGEYVNHHVEEEEGELFREVRRTELDLVALGGQLAQRKEQLRMRQAVGSGRRPTGDAASATA